MSSSNKMIAKNASYLYLRMFLLLLVGLYTSRVNLHSLGVEGYGVYNVVAGFVIMFGALTGALGNAISRFVQVELGKDNSDRLNLVFSTSVTIQVVVGVFMALLIEVIGVWFINCKMQLPHDSISAAFWVLQFSIVSFVVGLFYVPYYSSIIAHEKMSVFACISLLEAFLKLAIAFAVVYSPFNKIVSFAFLLLLNQFLISTIYIRYCRRNFQECVFRWTFDKSLITEMSSFVGWNMFAQGASVLSVQGVNMVMNVFFGVIVNAARAIETQVNNAIQQFITSFTTALVPPITKSYAAGEKNTSYELIYKGDRYSYYLILLLSLPILFEADAILKLWLKTPPDHASVFVCWTLAASLAKVLGGNTIFALIMADGKIRNFQIAIAVVGLLPLPLSWLFYKLGYSVVSAYVIYFIVHVSLIFVRLYFANRVTGLSVSTYIRAVLLQISLVTICAAIPPFALRYILFESDYRFLLVILVSLISTGFAVLFVGMKQNERVALFNTARNFVHRKSAK